MILQRLADDYDQDSGPLLLLLGLVSAARRLDRALAAAPRQLAPDEPAPDPTLLAALGVIALRERLLARLDRVETTGREVAVPDEGPPPRLLR